MTACDRCDKVIQGPRFRRAKQTGHTDRANGKRDIHYANVFICTHCVLRGRVRDAVFFVIRWAKAKVVASNAVFVIVILGALALYWYFFENTEASSQKTVAVTAVAPRANAPRLIPPGK